MGAKLLTFNLADSKIDPGKGMLYSFHCPACGCSHSFDVRTDGRTPNWTFNGDMEKPTFSPSLLYPSRGCHLFVRDGQIQYLGDCKHPYANRTVTMEDV